MIETIEITKLEYYNLLRYEETLFRLQRNGVDTWEFFEESITAKDLMSLAEWEEKTKKWVWEK